MPHQPPNTPPTLVPYRIDDALLPLLTLGLHDGNRAWKSFDWAALDRLHARGLISAPATAAKSVVISDEGLAQALALQQRLFGRAGQ